MNPETIAKPGGYTHVVEVVGPGRIVYIAGQLGLKPDGKIAGAFRRPGGAGVREPQIGARRGRGHVRQRRQAEQLSVDISANLSIYREVATGRQHRAAAGHATVGVPALARPDALYEAEAVVMLAKYALRQSAGHRAQAAFTE